MFCNNCGKEIPDDSKFCSSCGHPIITADQDEDGHNISLPAATEPSPGSAFHADADRSAGTTACPVAPYVIQQSRPTKGKQRGTAKVLKGFLTLLMGVMFLAWAFRGCSSGTTTNTTASAPQVPTTTTAPVVTQTLTLRLTDVTYQYGYLTVTGVLTNTCSTSIYSPSVKLEVWSSDKTVLLGSDTAWATGTLWDNFKPGSNAAIDFDASVSGAPNNVKYDLKCDDAVLTVVHAEK